MPPLEFLLFCINHIEILVAIWSQCPFSVAVSNSIGDHNPRLLKKSNNHNPRRESRRRGNRKQHAVCATDRWESFPAHHLFRFCTSLWREYLHVSNGSRHLVFRIFSTVWKIFLRFCQCPRHRFQDLSTLLAVSKASMIPYCKASISKKAIQWVRVEVGWSVFLSSYGFESHTSTRGAAEEDRKEESCSWRRSGSGLWGMHERSKIRTIAVSIRTTLVISWRKPDRNAQGSLIMWEPTASNRESQSLDSVKQGMNPGDRSIDGASGGNGVVTDARGAASHTSCKWPHTNYKATRTLLTRQPASVHVWQNLSPVCLKICGAVAGLVAESELHTTTDRYSAHWTRKQFSSLFFHLWSSSVFFGQFCDVAKVAMIHGKI